MKETVRKWVLEPHLCSDCGGRVLRCVEGNGMTPGGNAIHRCADCGKSGTDSNVGGVCWCSRTHRGSHETAYLCLPFSMLEKEPWLEEGFRACGCDPARGDVGIMLRSDLARLRSAPPQESKAERAQRLVTPLKDGLARAFAANGRDRTSALEALRTRIEMLEYALRQG